MAKSIIRKSRKQEQVETIVPQENQLENLFKAGLMDLILSSGLAALHGLVEDEIRALCGDRYKNVSERALTRWGTTASPVVLGGKRVLVKRGRVRNQKTGKEVPLNTISAFNSQDLLAERHLENMLIGISTRKYLRSEEARVPGHKNYADSKSSISRNYVLKTKQKLNDWMNSKITEDFPILLIDGTVFKAATVIIVLGIDHAGNKRVLGAWDGSTENSRVCIDLLQSLIERGLDPGRVQMVGLDGGKAIHKAVTDVLGKDVLIQRCQVHKQRNVTAYLPKEMHHRVRWEMNDAYNATSYKKAKKTLDSLIQWLSKDYEQAAKSLAEGLEETLLMHKLGITGALKKTLVTTNLIENLNSRIKDHTARVRHWKNSNMVIRWVYTGIYEAEKGFRKIKGYKDIDKLLMRIEEFRKSGFISLDTSEEAA